MNAKILAVVGLGGNMFKPFTNTKTIVLFIQKRYKPFETEEQVRMADKDEDIVYCVTEKSGKDKTGKIVADKDGTILSDIPEITDYIVQNVRFKTERELKEEYVNSLEQPADQ